MKRIKLAAAVLAGMTLCASLLTGCSGGPQLYESGGVCTTSSGDVTYRHASSCYVPASLGDKRGNLKITDNLTYDLYEIEGMDPNEWLATEQNDVLYADGVTLPSLHDMEPTAVYIYTNTTLIKKSAEIFDKAVINELLAACEEANAMHFTPSASAHYLVRFYSDKYPGLYYSLRYVVYGGSYYLYDQSTKISYPIDRQIENALNAVTEAQTSA